MLKTAELANKNLQNIQVVLRDDEAARERYRQFFGLREDQIFMDGVEEWLRGD